MQDKRRGEVNTRIWWENLRDRYHLENLSADRRVLSWVLKRKRGGSDWMNLAYDRDKWQSLVNTAVNLRGP